MRKLREKRVKMKASRRRSDCDPFAQFNFILLYIQSNALSVPSVFMDSIYQSVLAVAFVCLYSLMIKSFFFCLRNRK